MSIEEEIRCATAYLEARGTAWGHLLTYRRYANAMGPWLREKVDSPPDLIELIDAYHALEHRRCVENLAAALARVDESMSLLDAMVEKFRSLKGQQAKRLMELALTARGTAIRHRNELVSGSLWIVDAFVYRHRRSAPAEDLRQWGVMGLIRAAERFDHTRGVRFATHARFWVEHSIKRSVDDLGHTIRVPVRVRQGIRKISEARRRMPDADAETLAETVGLKADHIRKLDGLKSLIGPTVSVPQDSWSSFGDPESAAVSSDEAERLHRAIALLPERMRKVLALRYGMGDHDEATLPVAGREIGVSRERVRQLQNKALARLREALLS